MSIRSIDDLPVFLADNHVDIAILTLPKENAEVMAHKLVGLGVKAFWNFAHIDLELPEGVIVQNVHLSDSLMQLSYNLTL